MPPASLTPDEIVSRILQVFRDHGYEGASLARLSTATGLGRSSLYHHFPNGKADMANAAMQAVSQWYSENVLGSLCGTETAHQRLCNFTRKIAEFYQNGELACLTDVFSIGEAGGLFQQYLALRIGALTTALAQVLIDEGIPEPEARRRAENAIISIQGGLVVSRALHTTAPFLRILQEMPATLLQVLPD